jgi:hypothetical protein
MERGKNEWRKDLWGIQEVHFTYNVPSWETTNTQPSISLLIIHFVLQHEKECQAMMQSTLTYIIHLSSRV